MGNEIAYHKEQARWHSTFREDKWGCTTHADQQRDHHLRQVKRLERKEEARRQKKAAKREAEKREAQYRRESERRAMVAAAAQRQQNAQRWQIAQANQQKEDLMVAIMAKYNKCHDECEKWNDSIFSHLSPGTAEMESIMIKTRNNHLRYSMEMLMSVNKSVVAWASVRRQEIAKVEIVNRAVREWNLFIERLGKVGGRSSLERGHASEVDACESKVDNIINNRSFLSLEAVQSAGCQIKELLDSVYSELNKRKAIFDGMRFLALNDTSQNLHRNITCDKCDKCPIQGKRYKCAECNNYDLCEYCYTRDMCHKSHLFLMIEKEGAAPVALLHKSGPYGHPNPSPEIRESVQRLYELSVKNNVNFRELFDYSVSEDSD